MIFIWDFEIVFIWRHFFYVIAHEFATVPRNCFSSYTTQNPISTVSSRVTEAGPEPSTIRLPLLFSIRQWMILNVLETGPVHGNSSFTSHAKDIIPQSQESVMTQPVNQ